MAKRLFDFSLALILTLILLPLMLVIALAIRLKLGAPVLFTQLRPGFRARPFEIYKFRTMSEERGADGKLLVDDERLRGVGRLLRRLSLDELPQLLNVLKGELSFVGPRPLLMEYLPRYSEAQSHRHDVAPGITGWAQIHGRNAISWDEKFELDLWYVKHHSFALDLRILGLTALKVLRGEGVSPGDRATMPEFLGSDRKKS